MVIISSNILSAFSFLFFWDSFVNLIYVRPLILSHGSLNLCSLFHSFFFSLHFIFDSIYCYVFNFRDAWYFCSIYLLNVCQPIYFLFQLLYFLIKFFLSFLSSPHHGDVFLLTFLSRRNVLVCLRCHIRIPLDLVP